MSDERSAAVDRSDMDGDVVSVAKGAGIVASGSLFSSASRLVMAVMLANWLGADGYGLYILVITVAFAASGLASFGLHMAMERHVAVNARRGDDAGIRGSIQIGMAGTLLGSAIVGGVLPWLADPIARDLFDEPALVPLIQLSAALTPILAVSTLLGATMRGLKRMDIATVADDVIQPTVRFLMLGVLLIPGITVYRAGLAIACSYVVALVFLFVALQRRVPLVGRGLSARRDTRELIGFSAPFWFAGILRVLRTRLQPLLLGIFGTTANVGVFSVVTSANMFGRLANASIRTAIRPTMAELHDLGDTAQVGHLYATTTRWTMSANLPVFVVMILAPGSLLAVFGGQFESGVTPLVIVAFAELANAATGICGPIISMSPHNKMKMVNSTIWVSVSIVSNIVMIPLWGMTGAALAIVVSTTVINVIRVVELWVLMRILPWDRNIWKPLVSAAVAAAAGLGLLRLLPDPLGPIWLVVFVLVVSVTFVVVLFQLRLDEDDRRVLGALLTTVSRGRLSSLAVRLQGDDSRFTG